MNKMKQQINQKKVKFLITPDKFRGSLNATEICQTVQEALIQFQIQNHGKNLKFSIQKLELADGGQGTLQTLLKHLNNLQSVELIAKDPLFRQIKTQYLVDRKHNIAYIQMAKISGLNLLNQKQRNPLKTTTFGVGQLIYDAIQKKYFKIYLFVGGSATNDAGIGMANALGYKFLDQFDNEIQPVGQNLILVKKILEPSTQTFQKIIKTDISVVSDVQIFLYGKNGASYVFGPQKGADQKAVELLDKGLFNINEVIKQKFLINLQTREGSGAAGGIGGGSIVFLRAKMEKGIQKIMNILNYDQKALKSDILITGEGKFDKQSLQGKVVYGVLKKAKKFNKILLVLCGINQLNFQQDIQPLYNNVTIISLVDKNTTKQEATSKAKQIIKKKIRQFCFKMQF